MLGQVFGFLKWSPCRLRLSTAPLFMLLCSWMIEREAVLGNTWWALTTNLTKKQEKVLLLWLNSTLSLLLVFGRRVATRSAWMQMKKPAWVSMHVLDVRALSTKQVNKLAADFDTIAEEGLEALAKLNDDPVRKKIDAALSKTLGLPDLANIRMLLGREPGLTGPDTATETPDELEPTNQDDLDLQKT